VAGRRDRQHEIILIFFGANLLKAMEAVHGKVVSLKSSDGTSADLLDTCDFSAN
jgi:hypothetical protein